MILAPGHPWLYPYPSATPKSSTHITQLPPPTWKQEMPYLTQEGSLL